MIGRGKGQEEGAKNAQEELLTDWMDLFFFTCCDCVDRGFPEGEGGSAKKSKREEEGRLAKIPSPMEKYNVAIKRRDETRRKRKQEERNAMSGSAGPSPVRIIWPTAKARTVTLLGRRPRHGW